MRGEFSDESLLYVAARPWFMDIANYKATKIIPHDLIGTSRRNFFVMSASTSGMIHICSKLEQITC